MITLDNKTQLDIDSSTEKVSFHINNIVYDYVWHTLDGYNFLYCECIEGKDAGRIANAAGRAAEAEYLKIQGEKEIS